MTKPLDESIIEQAANLSNTRDDFVNFLNKNLDTSFATKSMDYCPLARYFQEKFNNDDICFSPHTEDDCGLSAWTVTFGKAVDASGKDSITGREALEILDAITD